MAKSTFLHQLKWMFWRNLLIKVRLKSQSITEFMMPVYFILLLAMIKFLSTSNVDTSAITKFPENVLTFGNGSGYQTQLLVVPNSAEQFIKHHILTQLPYNLSVVPFDTEADMEKWFQLQGQGADTVRAAVVFLDADFTSYDIRTPYSSSPPTNVHTVNAGLCRQSDDCMPEFYLTNSYIELQTAIDKAILSSYNLSAPSYNIQRMPKASFTPDSSYIRSFAPIYYVYAYSFFIQFLLTALVTEKKEKIKETMKIMGLRESAFWVSWNILYLGVIIVVSLIAILMARLTNFFQPTSDLFVFFLLLVLYGMSVINLAFMMVPFFNNPKVAGPVASLATTVIGLVYFGISLTSTYGADGMPRSPIPVPVQWILCLFSPIALALGIDRGIYLDVAGLGMTWKNLSLGSGEDGVLPMSASLIMLAVDAFLYFLLAIWLDNVVPGDYGRTKPLLFCFMPSYWREKRSINDERAFLLQVTDSGSDHEEHADVEKVAQNISTRNKIRIADIHKFYEGKAGRIAAVNGISLEIYEGQITCLLGHNGAGKTSLIDMLVGLSRPSNGTATICGLDISKGNDMVHIRTMTGVCPQQNVMMPYLTTRENLRLFGALKGLEGQELEQAVDSLLTDLDLVVKKNSRSSDLSGGQKRKLCVGMALIGDPKVIFLDEPTAGMDPNARRHLWHLLKRKKEGKIIVLSTHFMDEADILADRKAVLSKGKLRCCGSSVYLKTKFGVGYHLSAVVDPSLFEEPKVSQFISFHVPDATLDRQHGAEVSYTLPYKDVDRFADLFHAFEQKADITKAESLGIQSYGISMTTLEEVFLKLGVEEGVNVDSRLPGQENAAADPVPTDGSTPPDLMFVSEDKLQFQQFATLVKLRAKIIRRSKGAFFARIILPVIFILISMFLAKYTQNSNQVFSLPRLVLNQTAVFDPPINAFAVINSTSGQSGLSQLLVALKDFTGKSVDIVDRNTNLLDVPPHQIGVKVNQMSAQQPFGGNFTILYNTSWMHSLPLCVSTLSNSLLLLGTNTKTIQAASHPLPPTSPQLGFQSSAFFFSLMIGSSIVFLPGNLAVEVVRDRECKARSQLRISGVSAFIYWTSTLFVDLTQAFGVALLIIIMILAFQIPPLVTSGAMLCSVMFFLLYTPLYICLGYAFSYFFNSVETTRSVLFTVLSFMNFLPYMAMSIMSTLPGTGLQLASKYLHYVFTWIDPMYTISGFYFHINKLYIVESFVQQTPTPIMHLSKYFEWNNLIVICLLPPLFWIPFLCLLMRIGEEVKFGGAPFISLFRCCSKIHLAANHSAPENEDEDVARERRLVEAGQGGTNSPTSLIANGLRKEFKKQKSTRRKKSDSGILVAVNNASFHVEAGEVFGLLGPNGAGKSTVLNMLTSEIRPTAGSVTIDGDDVHSSLSKAYQKMGYCPQHDALWETVNLQEHLFVYAAIRGLIPESAKQLAQYYIKALRVQEHGKKQAAKLSGGTKRKLSFIISMLGNPKIVLLDEPSTGMDPQSKRFFWDTISSSFTGTSRGALLTTHYMEEADALCSRIAIMVNGNLACLGSAQHLKTKFGSGYTLELKLGALDGGSTTLGSAALSERMRSLFPSAVCLENFADRAVFKVDQTDVSSLGKAFNLLQAAKADLGVLDYSFSQPSLEQVFLEFAKQQFDDADEVPTESAVTHNA